MFFPRTDSTCLVVAFFCDSLGHLISFNGWFNYDYQSLTGVLIVWLLNDACMAFVSMKIKNKKCYDRLWVVLMECKVLAQNHI